MDQLGVAATAAEGNPTIPSTPPQRRTAANVQDHVRSFPATILSCLLSARRQGADRPRSGDQTGLGEVPATRLPRAWVAPGSLVGLCETIGETPTAERIKEPLVL